MTMHKQRKPDSLTTTGTITQLDNDGKLVGECLHWNACTHTCMHRWTDRSPPIPWAHAPSRSCQMPSRILAEVAVKPRKIFTVSRKTRKKQAVKPPQNSRLATNKAPRCLETNCTELHLCMTTYSSFFIIRFFLC